MRTIVSQRERKGKMIDEEYQKILEEYDFVYSCTPRYLHNEVVIYKSPDLLRSEERAEAPFRNPERGHRKPKEEI